MIKIAIFNNYIHQVGIEEVGGMQTYTHFFVTAAVSQILFPGDNVAQATMVAATIIPDVPAATQFALDVMNKKPPLLHQSKGFVMVQEICHSLVVWLIALMFPLPAFCGIYSHLLLDVISHSGDEFKEVDPGMLWPLPWKVRGLFEYRTKGAGGLWTPLDILISALAIFSAVVLRFF